jgi:hypothetical protein
MSTEDRLSWAAIILSGVAFVISVSQALQQYLATAEGYRRCQKKVLGLWADKYTYRLLRIKELRFETIFGTPNIRLTPLLDGQERWFSTSENHSLVANGIDDLVPTESQLGAKGNTNWVCWLRLLQEMKELHTALLDSVTAGPNGIIGIERRQLDPPDLEELEDGTKLCYNFPTFVPEIQSWDFVPADVLKPLAKIGISDLAVVMRRMGLKWLQFEPMDSLLRAEGNGLSLTSSYLRGVGCVVTYSRVRARPNVKKFPLSLQMIPCVQADAMGFGLLPSRHRLAAPFFDISSVDRVLETFELFQPSPKALQRLRDLSRGDNFFYAFTDLIPLTAPFMRRRSSPIVRIPSPMDRPLWLFYSNTGRKAIRYLLTQEAAKLPQTPSLHLTNLTDLITTYAELIDSHPQLRDASDADRRSMSANNPSPAQIALLDTIQTQFESVEAYLATQSAALVPLRSSSSESATTPDLYSDIVTVHLRNAVEAELYAERKLRDSPRDTYVYPSAPPRFWNFRIAEALAQYSYRWDVMRQELVEMGWVLEGGKVQFVALWASVMVRGFYWMFCHELVEGPRVRAEFWGSRMEVYVG